MNPLRLALLGACTCGAWDLDFVCKHSDDHVVSSRLHDESIIYSINIVLMLGLSVFGPSAVGHLPQG